MSKLGDRMRDYLTGEPLLSVSCMLTPGHVACVTVSGRERRVNGHSVSPLPPGSVRPSFEGKNIRDTAALEETVKAALHKLPTTGHDLAFLAPEACLKSFILSFESFPASKEEQKRLILWRLKRQMPSLPEDVRLSWDRSKANARTRVFVTLAKQSVLDEYEGLMAGAGFRVRSIGLPSLALLNLLGGEHNGNVLVVNVEEGSLALLFLLEGVLSLYRLKGILQADGLQADTTAAVIKEILSTLAFIEDRENARVDALRIRIAWRDHGSELLEKLREHVPVPFRLFDPVSGSALNPKERHFLSPLLAQLK